MGRPFLSDRQKCGEPTSGESLLGEQKDQNYYRPSSLLKAPSSLDAAS